MADKATIIPVILSGGAGSRLWPLSRRLFPKQLLPLAGENSMLQETVARVTADGFGKPIVICNEEQRFLIAEQLRKAGVKNATIVLEPVGRNTAPAATIAALLATKVEQGDGVNSPPVTPYQGLDHFGLTVKDIDAVAAEIRAKGVEFTREPTTIRPGVRICFIRGPQGISIELLERDKKYA